MPYRGKNLPELMPYEIDEMQLQKDKSSSFPFDRSSIEIYKEHDDNYLRECLLNLKAKGAELENGKTIDEMLIELDLKGKA